jgi:hypothetical protein
MSKLLKVLGVVVMCLSIGLTAVACGAPSPSAVTKKFYAALEKGNMEAAGKYATPETVAMLAVFGSKLPPMLKAYGGIKSMSEKIDGDNAKVTIVFKNDETSDVDLKRIDGKWKVHSSGK